MGAGHRDHSLKYRNSFQEYEMNVRIKQFDVQMELKNKGVEFEIRDTQG